MNLSSAIMDTPKKIPWATHAAVVRIVNGYLLRHHGDVIPAGLAACLAEEIPGHEVDLVAESRLTAAISSVVWERDGVSANGWRRREDATVVELVAAIEGALPLPSPPLILTEKPGLTGDGRGDLDRIAQWSAQEEALERLRGKTVGLDFDGTIHYYERWTGVEPTGDPTPYAVEFVAALVAAGVRVVISTCRAAEAGGREAVEAWLTGHGFPAGLIVTSEKPLAVAYVDDRAVPYRGTWLDCLQAAAALAGHHAAPGSSS